MILAIPADFGEFYEAQLRGYDTQIETVRVISNVGRFHSFYSLIIKFKTQSVADTLFNALNGRFFNEDHQEIMYTVFLSELVIQASAIPPPVA